MDNNTGSYIFQDMTAWFSKSCSEDVKEKWKNSHGKTVANQEKAMFLFSDDPSCKETISIYNNKSHIVVFKSAWIEQAVFSSQNTKIINQDIGKFILMPIGMETEVPENMDSCTYKEFVNKDLKEREDRWKDFEKEFPVQSTSSKTNESIQRTCHIRDVVINIDPVEFSNRRKTQNSLKTQEMDCSESQNSSPISRNTKNGRKKENSLHSPSNKNISVNEGEQGQRKSLRRKNKDSCQNQSDSENIVQERKTKTRKSPRKKYTKTDNHSEIESDTITNKTDKLKSPRKIVETSSESEDVDGENIKDSENTVKERKTKTKTRKSPRKKYTKTDNHSESEFESDTITNKTDKLKSPKRIVETSSESEDIDDENKKDSENTVKERKTTTKTRKSPRKRNIKTDNHNESEFESDTITNKTDKLKSPRKIVETASESEVIDEENTKDGEKTVKERKTKTKTRESPRKKYTKTDNHSESESDTITNKTDKLKSPRKIVETSSESENIDEENTKEGSRRSKSFNNNIKQSLKQKNKESLPIEMIESSDDERDICGNIRKSPRKRQSVVKYSTVVTPIRSSQRAKDRPQYNTNSDTTDISDSEIENHSSNKKEKSSHSSPSKHSKSKNKLKNNLSRNTIKEMHLNIEDVHSPEKKQKDKIKHVRQIPSISEKNDTETAVSKRLRTREKSTKNKAFRQHRSPANYDKKYIDPESSDSESESGKPAMKVSGIEKSVKNSGINSNCESSTKSYPKRSKDNSDIQNTDSENEKKAYPKRSRVISTETERNQAENVAEQTITKRLQSKTNLENFEVTRSNEEVKSKKTVENNELENEVFEQPKKSYPIRTRKSVEMKDCIAEADVSNMIDDLQTYTPPTFGSGTKKRKLFRTSSNSLMDIEPMLVLEDTPVNTKKRVSLANQHNMVEDTPVTTKKHISLANQQLSPNEIHQVLNEGTSKGKEVLLSGDVRSSSAKKPHPINEAAFSPTIVVEKIKSTKSQTMKDHLKALRHKKMGEKMIEDFAFGSFIGFTHIEDLDIPNVVLQDFIVNKNGCRVKLKKIC